MEIVVKRISPRVSNYLQVEISLRNIDIGSLVLIKDEQDPPLKWAKAKVIKLYPGLDSLTRVVTLKRQLRMKITKFFQTIHLTC